MQLESWQVHVLRVCGSVKPTKNETKPSRMAGPDSGGGSRLEEPSKTLVSKAPDHSVSVNWNVSGVKMTCSPGFALTSLILTLDVIHAGRYYIAYEETRAHNAGRDLAGGHQTLVCVCGTTRVTSPPAERAASGSPPRRGCCSSGKAHLLRLVIPAKAGIQCSLCVFASWIPDQSLPQRQFHLAVY